MRQIRQRKRIDGHQNDVRRPGAKKPINYGKYIYIVMLVAFAVWLTDIFLGDLLILRAKGMVLRDRTVVSVPYTASVVEIGLEQGDSVVTGQTIAVVDAPEIRERREDLVAERAGLERLIDQLQAEARVLDARRPVVAGRVEEAAGVVRSMETLAAKKLVGTNRLSQERAALLAEREALAALAAERRSIDRRVGTLDQQRDEVTEAIAALDRRYQSGVVAAGVDGIVGERAASVGTVVRPGEPIAEIFHGDAYVLAYLKAGALYAVAPGDAVIVQHGFASYDGMVETVLPVADALPAEFQQVFKSVERGQVVRIRFEHDPDLPLKTTIQVGSAAWSADHLIDAARLVNRAVLAPLAVETAAALHAYVRLPPDPASTQDTRRTKSWSAQWSLSD